MSKTTTELKPWGLETTVKPSFFESLLGAREVTVSTPGGGTDALRLAGETTNFAREQGFHYSEEVISRASVVVDQSPRRQVVDVSAVHGSVFNDDRPHVQQRSSREVRLTLPDGTSVTSTSGTDENGRPYGGTQTQKHNLTGQVIEAAFITNPQRLPQVEKPQYDWLGRRIKKK